jgi:hypothetical protein
MFKIDVKLMSNGREVSENEFAESPMNGAMKSVKAQITERLGNIVCPVHGEHLQVTIVNPSLDDLKIQIGGCCQEAIDMGTAAVS